jgi:hypothetical protein
MRMPTETKVLEFIFGIFIATITITASTMIGWNHDLYFLLFMTTIFLSTALIIMTAALTYDIGLLIKKVTTK